MKFRVGDLVLVSVQPARWLGPRPLGKHRRVGRITAIVRRTPGDIRTGRGRTAYYVRFPDFPEGLHFVESELEPLLRGGPRVDGAHGSG